MAQQLRLDDVQPAYSDLHNLRACDATVNSTRGNKCYDTTTTNGTGYAFPASPEAPLCSTDTDSWEPPPFDLVDSAEQLRNDRIYSLYETNRNPFVDHPEWVNLTFGPVQTNPPLLTPTAIPPPSSV